MSPATPRFLADESCDHAVVRALRAEGFDVIALTERHVRSVDAEVIAEANREQRILLTEDKDFGWLVFVSARPTAGVVLIRFAGARAALAEAIVELALRRAGEIAGAFTVVDPGRFRILRPPDSRG